MIVIVVSDNRFVTICVANTNTDDKACNFLCFALFIFMKERIFLTSNGEVMGLSFYS